MLKYFRKIKERKEKVIERSYDEYCQNPLTQKDIDEYNSVFRHTDQQNEAAFRLGTSLTILSCLLLIFPIVSSLSFIELNIINKIGITCVIGVITLVFLIQSLYKKINENNKIKLKIGDHQYIGNGNLHTHYLMNSYMNSENINPNHSVHKLINAIKALDRPILCFERHLILERLKV